MIVCPQKQCIKEFDSGYYDFCKNFTSYFELDSTRDVGLFVSNIEL